MCVVEFRLPAIQDLTLVQLQLHENLNVRWKNENTTMKPDRLQIGAFFGKCLNIYHTNDCSVFKSAISEYFMCEFAIHIFPFLSDFENL